MAYTYAGDPAASDVAAVRFEISDTNPSAPLLSDAEIAYAIAAESGQPADPAGVSLTAGPLFASAARCCETIARQLAMQADTETGALKVTYSRQAVTYAQRAAELRAKASGFHAPYAGGQSISEKQGWSQDPDTIGPAMYRGQFDNPWAGERDRGSCDGADLGPPVGD